MHVAALILLSVFVTSLISGVLGMAGGLILMAILVLLVSVPAAMIIHGAVQSIANGSRAWFLRDHIQWHILPIYIIGALAALVTFYAVVWAAAWLPSKNMVLLLIGLFPWVGLILPSNSPLVITHRPSQFICGYLVTFAQLTAGASGPLLDLFYVNSTLDRRAIVATKGITQTLGHLMKLGFYVSVLTIAIDSQAVSTHEVEGWLLIAAGICSIAATRVGTLVLGRFSNVTFRKVSQRVILLLGLLCILNGLRGLW